MSGSAVPRRNLALESAGSRISGAPSDRVRIGILLFFVESFSVHKFLLSSSVPWSNEYLAKSNSRVILVGAHIGLRPRGLPRINAARVPVRPKCFTGGRSSIGTAQCAGSELGETPVMESLSYMTE